MDVLRLLTGGTRRATKAASPESTKIVPRKKAKVHTNVELEALGNFDEESVLLPAIRKSMVALGYTEPTPIQRQLIPAMLGRQDVLATAETGSGKTLAFLLPMFAVLKPRSNAVGAVIVAPTRELATQTATEAQKFLQKCSRKFVVGTDVVVGTPLSLLQRLNSGELSVEKVEWFVLDEADKLLDLGFLPQMDAILEHYKGEVLRRRTAADERPLNLVLVSATLPDKVVGLATGCMVEPVRITVGHVQAANMNIEQQLVFAGSEQGKIPLLRGLAREGKLKPPCLVFVESKERAVELTNELLFDGLMVDTIHADRTKFERDRTIQAFREGKIWILVTTDVLGRGFNCEAIQQVVNFDVPKTAATYIHRIGRTGRAGRVGQALTLFTEDDVQVMRPVVNVMRESQVQVPDWLVKALPGKANARNGGVRNPEFARPDKKRRTVSTSVKPGSREAVPTRD